MAEKELKKSLAEASLNESLLFYGESFTFNVGPSKVKMSAHESIISKLPVIRTWCKSNCKEGLTKQIELPEDDPGTFHLLLEYLYTGVLRKPGLTIEDTMDAWGGLYILADKYKLNVLKREILTSLNVKPLLTRPIDYLKWIHEIFANVPDSEMEIASFFFDILLRILPFTHSDMTKVEELTKSGGRFAVALSRHQNREYIRHRADEQELKTLKDKAEKEIQNLKNNIERFKSNHFRHHRNSCCGCTLNI